MGVSKHAWLEWKVTSHCYGIGGKKRAIYQRLKGRTDGIEPPWYGYTDEGGRGHTVIFSLST